MSEEILKALMQLFAIIAKQDDGVEDTQIDYVHTFLKEQLSAEAVEEYMALFNKKAEVGKTSHKQKPRVNELVRILGLCRKINKTLNQKQKVIVLVRLYELINADRKFTEERMAIINTVAEVFNIETDEFKSIESYVIKDDPQELNYSNLLIVSDTDTCSEKSKYIQSEALDGYVFILQVKSVDLYFLRYTGSQDVYLNGLTVNNRRIYLFASGSTIKLPKGKPIYYSDVVSNFMEGTTDIKLSYNVNDVGFVFGNGGIGLRNINLSEGPGKLIGIMGASGAGKTTLLNVLSGINAPTSGSVKINGVDLHRESEKIEGVIGYIPQDDLLIEELTVFENLFYSAKLCFNDKSEDEITQLVDKTLLNLGLLERKNLKVGSPLNKMISGGQRKRLNIALELIREPSILFVDEPTSGLSSRDSENVMDLLSELALKGKLIFVVIHQPSSDIYKMFDKMVILDTGGYMIYNGNPVEALVYFKTLDNQINSEVGECPTCGNITPELIFNIVEAQVVDEFGRYTNKRKVKPTQWEERFQENITVEFLEDVKESPPSTLNIPTWLKQFKIYTLRDFFSKIANTQYIVLNLVEAPLLGFILSFIIYYIEDPNSPRYVFYENDNIPPYIFMSIVVALFLGLTVSAEEIFRDRKILKREAFLNLSRSSYLFSKILILTTISAIQALLYVIVGNTILGIQGMYFFYWFALFSTFVFANILGLNISATFNSAVTIYIIIPLLLIPQMALGGAMFSFDKLNRIFGGIGKVPLIAEGMTSRWIYEALMVHQFKDNSFERTFYGVEQRIANANFKYVYRIPKVEEYLDHVASLYKDQGLSENAVNRLHKDLEIVRNEIAKEKWSSYRDVKQAFHDLQGKSIESKSVKIELQRIAQLLEKLAHPFDPLYIALPEAGDSDAVREFLADLKVKVGEVIDEINQDIEFDKLNEEIIEAIREHLRFVSTFHSRAFTSADSERERMIGYLNDKDPKLYNVTKGLHHNGYLADIVKNVYEQNKIVEYKGGLIRQYELIYKDADNSNIFNFRAHFYAPRKHFLGKYFDTYWFNMTIVWLMTISLYIPLYYEHLKKVLAYFGSLKIGGVLEKIPMRKLKFRIRKRSKDTGEKSEV